MVVVVGRRRSRRRERAASDEVERRVSAVDVGASRARRQCCSFVVADTTFGGVAQRQYFCATRCVERHT